MKFRKVVLPLGIGMVAAVLSTPAFAAVTVGQTILHMEPVSPHFPPLRAPEDDGAVLMQPHDGTFETAFTIPTQEDVEFVQFWQFPSTEGTLLAFQACFYSLTTVASFQFEFVYYSVSTGGEEAEPGTLREDRDSPVFDILADTPTCKAIVFEAQGDPGVEIRELLAYLGVKWNGQDYPGVYILVDKNGPDTTNGWGRVTDFGSDWLPLRFTEPFTAYRNLAHRWVWLGPIIEDDTIFEDDFESGDTSAWDLTEPPPSDDTVTAFVTRDVFQGDLGGLTGADQLCSNAATTAGLTGAWTAWLSDQTTNAGDRIPDGEYRLVDGTTVVASDLADLTDGDLAAPIDQDENGDPWSQFVWTGTTPDGLLYVDTFGFSETCNNWADGTNDFDAVQGNSSSTDGNWTTFGQQSPLVPQLAPCSGFRSIYCFGVPDQP